MRRMLSMSRASTLNTPSVLTVATTSSLVMNLYVHCSHVSTSCIVS